MEDKDYREMIHLLCKALPLERVTVVHLRSDRGLKEQILAEQFEREGCEVVESCEPGSGGGFKPQDKGGQAVCGRLFVLDR